MTTGAELIAKERQRQIEVEGYDLEHDAKHSAVILFRAGQAYLHGNGRLWPWKRDEFKPRDPLSNLIRAGALFQAALDQDEGAKSYPRFRDRCAEEIDAILKKAREVDQ